MRTKILRTMLNKNGMIFLDHIGSFFSEHHGWCICITGYRLRHSIHVDYKQDRYNMKMIGNHKKSIKKLKGQERAV